MKYFVSWTTRNYGFGNGVIEVEKPIVNYDDLLNVEHQIRYKEKYPDLPIVIFYKRMYDE